MCSLVIALVVLVFAWGSLVMVLVFARWFGSWFGVSIALQLFVCLFVCLFYLFAFLCYMYNHFVAFVFCFRSHPQTQVCFVLTHAFCVMFLDSVVCVVCVR